MDYADELLSFEQFLAGIYGEGRARETVREMKDEGEYDKLLTEVETFEGWIGLLALGHGLSDREDVELDKALRKYYGMKAH